MENLLGFIKSNDLFRKFQVDDLLFTEFKCPPDETKSGIWWNSNFFAFVLAGESLLKTPQSEYILKPGACVFARKGSVLTVSQTQDDFCELLIFVPDHFIKDVISRYQIAISATHDKKLDTVIPLVSDHVVVSYFQSLLSYFAKPEPPPKSLLKHKFEELILHISSHQDHAAVSGYFQEICNRSKPSIREIMDYNFSSNLSLRQYAELCGRSLSSFKREFHKLYGTSPGKWLKHRRLQYSRYLLETTSLNIEEVCFESGFENRSHFIRIFKDEFGITPGNFRSHNSAAID